MLNKFKEFIKESYLFIIVLGLVIILCQFNMEFREMFEKIYFIIAFIIFILLFLLILYMFNKNRGKKKRIKKISKKDYEIVRKYYERKITNSIFQDEEYYELEDYLISIEYLCNDFLSGEKTLSIEKNEVVISKGTFELKEQIKYFNLEEMINETLGIIYKYYDNKGIWKK